MASIYTDGQSRGRTPHHATVLLLNGKARSVGRSGSQKTCLNENGPDAEERVRGGDFEDKAGTFLNRFLSIRDFFIFHHE